jgi:hypothetical protein
MYRRAMLRAYAESVGLDAQAALQAFELTFEAKAPVPVATVASTADTGVDLAAPPPPVTVAAMPRRRLLTVAGGVALAAVAVLVMSGRRRDVPEPPPQTTERILQAGTAAAIDIPVPPQSAVEPPRAQAPAAPATSAAAEQPVDSSGTVALGPLVVQSNPAGARVTVNGIGWGVTPITIRNLPAGPKRVRLTKDGYVSQERTVILDPTGQPTRTRVTLPVRP